MPALRSEARAAPAAVLGPQLDRRPPPSRGGAARTSRGRPWPRRWAGPASGTRRGSDEQVAPGGDAADAYGYVPSVVSRTRGRSPGGSPLTGAALALFRCRRTVRVLPIPTAGVRGRPRPEASSRELTTAIARSISTQIPGSDSLLDGDLGEHLRRLVARVLRVEHPPPAGAGPLSRSVAGSLSLAASSCAFSSRSSTSSACNASIGSSPAAVRRPGWSRRRTLPRRPSFFCSLSGAPSEPTAERVLWTAAAAGRRSSRSRPAGTARGPFASSRPWLDSWRPAPAETRTIKGHHGDGRRQPRGAHGCPSTARRTLPPPCAAAGTAA